MRLYNATVSGNCYKVRLLLAHLGLAYDKIEIDLMSPDPRPDELQRLNPPGKVPVLILDDGTSLAESGAILWHLARDTPYLPSAPHEQTQLLRWMFFEQNSHEPTIAVNRNLISYRKQTAELADVIAFNHGRGVSALEAMDRHLATRPFFVGERYSIADIALFGYTHVAEEGNFDLEPYAAIRAWIERVRGQRGHVPIDG